MKYTHVKTKVIFTFGIYAIFWQYSIMCGLRDDFHVAIDPGSEMRKRFVPILTILRYWWFLQQIAAVEERLGVPGKRLSPARAMFVSGFWFGGVPYITKHVNGLYTFAAGRSAGASTLPIGGSVPAAGSWPEQAVG